MESDSDQTPVIELKEKFNTMRSFWNWKEIKEVLENMSKKRYEATEIVKILRKFKFWTEKAKDKDKVYDKKLTFDTLVDLYGSELPQIFSKVTSFVLSHDYDYPLFRQQHPLQHTFPKPQLLYLLCSMSLNLIPLQSYHSSSPHKTHQTFSYKQDFSFIFQHNIYKTTTVIEYLKRELGSDDKKDDEKMTIRREVSNVGWEGLIKKEVRLCGLTVMTDEDSIQDYFGDIKVDFANKYIGGGALSNGCVQQQIMFANHPQLYTTQLLCEQLEINQAIHLIGFKKYYSNDGYSYKTKYLGHERHLYTYDQHGRAREYITAIDAMVWPKDRSQSREQWSRAMLKRQIVKACVGFMMKEGNGKVVSGNWGCGAFGGDLRTKLLVQWIAASVSGKSLVYCPFGERNTVYNQRVFSKLEGMRVEEVYGLLAQAGQLCLKESYRIGIGEIDIYAKIEGILDSYRHDSMKRSG